MNMPVHVVYSLYGRQLKSSVETQIPSFLFVIWALGTRMFRRRVSEQFHLHVKADENFPPYGTVQRSVTE